MIGCYDMEGWPEIHSWTYSYNPRGMNNKKRGYTSCQIFATEFGHIFVLPMEGKIGINISQAIKKYFKEIGVPLHLICDQVQ